MKVRFLRRSAFTLIELLVVIAIIAVLIGLLLPAVQKVREASARSSCQNNLKQIALGVHGYHDSYQSFPVNGGPGASYNPSTPAWSWIARILPNIEQGNLYAACGVPTSNLNAGNNPTLVQTVVKTLLCPSDTAINGLPRTGDLGVPLGLTNYKGCCGSAWIWGCTQTGAMGLTGSNPGLDCSNGIFYRTDGVPGTTGHGPLTMTLIKDGTSNTFMVGEDIPTDNNWCAWPYMNYATGTCAIAPNSAMVSGQCGFNTPTDWPDTYSFRSNHSGGLQFAYADGHVSFISQTIDITLYRSLATYNGGEVVSPP